ncbi:hypothetical protein SAMN02910369_02671 [Lachnospiraceae bacterium NE2001]|nr:hypothetical protein SAMN02910369_02671 [Lachnospiraceae bacterium NE2001]
MLKMLYTDFRSALLNRGIQILMLVFSLYIVGYVLIMKIIMSLLDMGLALHADDVMMVYNETSIFVVTAATLIIYVSDFANGIVRNKLCAGAKRSEIFLAAIVNSVFVTLVISVLCQLLEMILALIFSEGIYNVTMSEMAFSLLETTISCISISIFSTAVIMMMGGNYASYVVGLGVAFFFKIFGIEVMRNLYPEEGPVTITGLKLAVYQFYDRYVPYSRCTGNPRWDMTSLLIGCAGLIVISVAAGLIVFNKKELK